MPNIKSAKKRVKIIVTLKYQNLIFSVKYTVREEKYKW